MVANNFIVFCEVAQKILKCSEEKEQTAIADLSPVWLRCRASSERKLRKGERTLKPPNFIHLLRVCREEMVKEPGRSIEVPKQQGKENS